MKICRICNINKKEDEFYKRPESNDGLRNDCIKCHNERSRKYNKEVYYPQKLRPKRQKIKEVALKMVNSNLICVNCGYKNLRYLCLDHVIELTELGIKRVASGMDLYKKMIDGTVSIQNMQILCMACNIEKESKRWRKIQS